MSSNTRGKTKTKEIRSNSLAEDDDEFVTLKVVRELLLEQKRIFKSLSSDLTKRVDGLVKQVSDELKSSLVFSQKDIDNHRKKIMDFENDVNNATNDINYLQEAAKNI